MAAANYAAMVQREDVDFELRDIDERILDMLEDGRCTRQHLATELQVSGDYIYQRVDLMNKLGVIDIIHDGFYQLADDADAESVDGDDTAEDGVVLKDLVAQADWGKSNYARTDARVAAVADALETVRDQQTATTPELVEIVESHLGDGSNNQRMLSDIAKQLDIVESPPSGSNKYRWLGEEE
jgi:hypothetical protein